MRVTQDHNYLTLCEVEVLGKGSLPKGGGVPNDYASVILTQ